VEPDTRDPADRLAAAPRPDRPPRSVHVVHGDAAARHQLLAALTARLPAARLLAADSAEAALEQAARTPPDAVLVDVTLAARHGFDLVARLRKTGATIVGLTADMSPDTLILAEMAGVAGFLRAPVDVDRLCLVLPLLEGPPSV
jgi:DNA-binding NarL/FixJ family response regulator